MIRETQRTPPSSSFISSRLSSLKLTSPKFDFTSFCRSTSLIEPFFPTISTMAKDIGLGLHILLNARSESKLGLERLCYCYRGSLLFEPLNDSLIPILHISCHRWLDPLQSKPKVRHRNTIRLYISPQRDEARLPANSF